jgi:hypothetical protein
MPSEPTSRSGRHAWACLSASLVIATLSACATDKAAADRRFIAEHRRNIERILADVASQAEKACGGPVIMVVDGDPADHGYEVSDYQCANK